MEGIGHPDVNQAAKHHVLQPVGEPAGERTGEEEGEAQP
jgi:hypothetical protein